MGSRICIKTTKYSCFISKQHRRVANRYLPLSLCGQCAEGRGMSSSGEQRRGHLVTVIEVNGWSGRDTPTTYTLLVRLAHVEGILSIARCHLRIWTNDMAVSKFWSV
ncbi:unnamed protein product, partial [Mycena citricolor]